MRSDEHGRVIIQSSGEIPLVQEAIGEMPTDPRLLRGICSLYGRLDDAVAYLPPTSDSSGEQVEVVLDRTDSVLVIVALSKLAEDPSTAAFVLMDGIVSSQT